MYSYLIIHVHYVRYEEGNPDTENPCFGRWSMTQHYIGLIDVINFVITIRS